jgi:HEAT repeat protein
LRRTSIWSQTILAHALAGIGTDAVVPVLKEMATDGHRPVRLAARSGLERLNQQKLSSMR